MSTIKVIAGDLHKGSWQFTGTFGAAVMSYCTMEHVLTGESINLKTDVEIIEQLTEEKIKKLAGTAAWGQAGAALFDPLGPIGGMLLGENKNEVAFVCHLKDCKKFIATTDGKTWTKILAARFE